MELGHFKLWKQGTGTAEPLGKGHRIISFNIHRYVIYVRTTIVFALPK